MGGLVLACQLRRIRFLSILAVSNERVGNHGRICLHCPSCHEC